jgi:hypothetical protein
VLEVVFVDRPLLIVLLVAVLVVPAYFAQAEPPKNNLIQAKPEYLEAAHVPTVEPNTDPLYPPSPTPSEQMYVFWIMGKILSFPVDTLESYVTRLRGEWNAKAVAVPASAPAQPNPFEKRHIGQIPPAPPVVLGAGSQ